MARIDAVAPMDQHRWPADEPSELVVDMAVKKKKTTKGGIHSVHAGVHGPGGGSWNMLSRWDAQMWH